MSTPQTAPVSGVPVSSRVQAGDVIAEKYVVEKVLAEGGMGVVVAAQHKQLRRRVALKFLLPDLCQMREVVARFLREAQAMTTIQNEHVARVLDVGTTAEGAPFMVMEYLEGEDLAQTLERRGRLPVDEALELTLQGMEALAEAHLHGFVHRDLKPSNLFVTRRADGSPLVKVLDFGISKVASPDDVGGADLTHAHGLLGSPLYMSPEQIRSSKSVDNRADIWTLGIILYELLVGKPPFEADSVPAVLAAIIADDPPSVKVARPDVPDEVAAAIFKCLQRNRDNRYSDVGILARDLAPFTTREGQLSVERILRIVAQQQRQSNPMIDLNKPTPSKGITPVHGSAGPASTPNIAVITPAPSGNEKPNANAFSPLAATAHDPNLVMQRMGEAKKDLPPPSSQNGEGSFGKYKLIAVLGQGGMADVFLAVLAGPEGLGFSKLVVIKRLRSNLAADPEFVSMLVDEARIAAKLNHPNVVQTHEVGVIDNEYYIAMEYLDGQPLNRIVQRIQKISNNQSKEPLPLAFKVGIVIGMLAGVHHAHELADFDGSPLHLVHRDVTPQNVFVTYEGQVKVVDFGIAKARGRATETGQGIVKGKVAYMAPEQAGGKDIDHRADVFAAGVVLWELLTGERMWKGLDDVAIIQKLMLDKIPSSPRTINPEVPKALDAIVKKALSKKSADRYTTAQEMQVALERFMETEGLKCTPRELGEFTSNLFGDRRKQTRSLIEAQLSALRTSGSRVLQAINLAEGAERGSITPSTGLKLERLDRDAVPDGEISQRDPAMARSHPGHSVPGGKSRLPIIGGVAVVLATLVVIAILGTKKPPPHETVASSTTGDPTSAPPPATTSAAIAPPTTVTTAAVPAGATIQLVLTTTTANAEFAIDDEPKAKAPVTITRPKDGKQHVITLSAPGHRSESKRFTFDSDVNWTLGLVPGTGAHVSPPAPAKSAPSASAATAATPPAPTTSGKKKRELDDSPY